MPPKLYASQNKAGIIFRDWREYPRKHPQDPKISKPLSRAVWVGKYNELNWSVDILRLVEEGQPPLTEERLKDLITFGVFKEDDVWYQLLKYAAAEDWKEINAQPKVLPKAKGRIEEPIVLLRLEKPDDPPTVEGQTDELPEVPEENEPDDSAIPDEDESREESPLPQGDDVFEEHEDDESSEPVEAAHETDDNGCGLEAEDDSPLAAPKKENGPIVDGPIILPSRKTAPPYILFAAVALVAVITVIVLASSLTNLPQVAVMPSPTVTLQATPDPQQSVDEAKAACLSRGWVWDESACQQPTMTVVPETKTATSTVKPTKTPYWFGSTECQLLRDVVGGRFEGYYEKGAIVTLTNYDGTWVKRCDYPGTTLLGEWTVLQAPEGMDCYCENEYCLDENTHCWFQHAPNRYKQFKCTYEACRK